MAWFKVQAEDDGSPFHVTAALILATFVICLTMLSRQWAYRRTDQHYFARRAASKGPARTQQVQNPAQVDVQAIEWPSELFNDDHEIDFPLRHRLLAAFVGSMGFAQFLFHLIHPDWRAQGYPTFRTHNTVSSTDGRILPYYVAHSPGCIHDLKSADSPTEAKGVTFIQTGQDSTYYSFFSRVRVEHLARPEHDVIIVPSRIGMPEGGERTFVNDSLDIIKAVFGRSQASMQQRRVYNSISSGSAIAARTMVGMHIAGVTDIAHTFHMDGPISNLPETLQYYTARAGKIVHIILKLGVLRSVAAAKKAGINVDQQRNTFTALHALIKTRNDGNAAPMQFVVTGGIHDRRADPRNVKAAARILRHSYRDKVIVGIADTGHTSFGYDSTSYVAFVRSVDGDGKEVRAAQGRVILTSRICAQHGGPNHNKGLDTRAPVTPNDREIVL